MLRYTLLLFLVFFSCLSSADVKPVLNVISENWEGVIDADGDSTYRKIIKALYGDKYRLKMKTMSHIQAAKMMEAGEADIVITTQLQHYDSLVFSEQHIDVDYPIHLVFDPNKFKPNTVEDLTGKLIAGKVGWGLEKHLPKGNWFYELKDTEGVSHLIINGRIDGALIYGYNLRLADPDSLLSNIQLAPELPVYLGFSANKKGTNLKHVFEAKMRKLVEKKTLSKLFSSEIEYQHANLTGQHQVLHVEWHFVTKLFNETNQKLEVVPWEFTTSNYIANKLTGVKIEFKQSSFSETKKKLTENGNTCSINIRKPKDLDNSIVFSQPIYSYSKPRLFTLKGSEFEGKLNTLLTNDKLAIDNLLEQYPNSIIVVQENRSIHKKLSQSLSEQHVKNILAIEGNLNIDKFINLLNKKRADAFILWPSMIADLGSDEIKSKLVSYTLNKQLYNSLTTYIGCHNDLAGNDIINQINELLKDERHQKNIFLSIAENMEINSSEVFLEELNMSFIK